MEMPAVSNRIVKVTAFIDWNTQLLLTKINGRTHPDRAAEVAFQSTAGRIARCLDNMDSTKRFKVMMRLYHGWHQGYEPTSNRKAVNVVVGRADYVALSPRTNVVFSPDVEFGDRLTKALDKRLHRRLGIHLPNTARRKFRDDLEEKMVDTALTADVVATAHSNLEDWIIVVTEDDDLVPAVYVAEAALENSDARVALLRKRNSSGMINLDDLLENG